MAGLPVHHKHIINGLPGCQLKLSMAFMLANINILWFKYTPHVFPSGLWAISCIFNLAWIQAVLKIKVACQHTLWTACTPLIRLIVAFQQASLQCKVAHKPAKIKPKISQFWRNETIRLPTKKPVWIWLIFSLQVCHKNLQCININRELLFRC